MAYFYILGVSRRASSASRFETIFRLSKTSPTGSEDTKHGFLFRPLSLHLSSHNSSRSDEPCIMRCDRYAVRRLHRDYFLMSAVAFTEVLEVGFFRGKSSCHLTVLHENGFRYSAGNGLVHVERYILFRVVCNGALKNHFRREGNLHNDQHH